MDDSDETLMLRAGTGDREACAELVARHLGRIVTFARRTLGNRSDAEEAAQDVFLRVWSAAPRWKLGSARFSTRPHRVAMNVCLDRIEKKREALPGELPEVIDDRPEPLLALAASEVERHVGAALASLPAKQRVAVTLCHYQGLRNSDAADVMGVSVEALESLLLARGPRLVMEHQQELGLKPAQVEAIKQAMLETQRKLLDLQWQLDAESEALGKLLDADHVDESAVLAELDRVTEIERQVKKTNFALLVRIKNQLDAEQQKKLRTYRKTRPPGPPGGPPGEPPPPPP